MQRGFNRLDCKESYVVHFRFLHCSLRAFNSNKLKLTTKLVFFN